MKNNWPIKKLGELADVRMGETLIKKDLTGGGTPIFSAGTGIKPWGFTKKNKLTFGKNSIVLSARGTIGEPRLPLLEKFTATQTTIVVTNKSENVLDTVFLWRFLQTFNFNTIKNQAAIPMMTVSDVNKIEISLPPLKIQKQIVTKIEELFEKIDKAKELRQKAQEETGQIFQSALREIFSKTRKKYGIRKFIRCIGKLPKQIKGIPKKRYQEKGKFPIIDQGEVLIGGYTNDDSKIYHGELPVIIFGDHTRIFKYINFPFSIGADGTKIIIPKREEFDPKFFYYILQSLNIESLGYTRHYKILKTKEIPIPPLSEQKKIVAELDNLREKIDKLKVLQEQQAKELEELKKSILEKSFSGKLIKEKK